MTLHPLRRDFWRRVIPLIGLVVALATLSGCITTAGDGATAAVYARGDLEANLARDYRAVVEAAKGALGDLQLGRISENQEPAKSVLVSRTAGDKKVEVAINQSANKLTNIKIRIGVFGDEQLSRSILDRIKARL